MGRRVMNRKEMRNDFDAAERRNTDEERVEEEEETDDDEDGEEEEEGEEGEEGADDEEAGADDEDGDGDDDEDAPKKKKKAKVKAKPKPVVKPKSRSRAAKIVRMRIVWGVFNNSHQMVATYEYPRKDEAEAHAAKLMADKRSTHFIQPIKEAIVEEKKEK